MSILRKTKVEAEVNMSPLIDAVFLLLIFFLVATMTKKENRDIDIDLPNSSSAVKLMPDDRTLVIGIDPSQRIYLEGRATTMTELMSQLRDLAIEDPSRRIRLDADKATPFFKVIEILNLLQFRGLNNVGIRTYDEHYNR